MARLEYESSFIRIDLPVPEPISLRSFRRLLAVRVGPVRLVSCPHFAVAK